MSATALGPGALVGGDFRIVRLLASGGMGAVYIAEQRSTTTATLHDGPLGCTHTVPSEHTRGAWDGRCGGA